MICPNCGKDLAIIGEICSLCGAYVKLPLDIKTSISGLEKIEPMNTIYPTIMEATLKLNEVIDKVNRIMDYLNQVVGK